MTSASDMVQNLTNPARGEFIPEEIPLDVDALVNINIKTPEMRDWMVENLEHLQRIS